MMVIVGERLHLQPAREVPRSVAIDCGLETVAEDMLGPIPNARAAHAPPRRRGSGKRGAWQVTQPPSDASRLAMRPPARWANDSRTKSVCARRGPPRRAEMAAVAPAAPGSHPLPHLMARGTDGDFFDATSETSRDRAAPRFLRGGASVSATTDQIFFIIRVFLFSNS